MVSFKTINTILLIEDNKDIGEELAEYLELEGYNFLFINDGKEGVELARELVPDLIRCDVLKSEMDGSYWLYL